MKGAFFTPTAAPSVASEAAAAMAASAPPAPTPVSVYDLRPRAAKLWILAGAACISVLTPATDTVYLPALPSVRRSLGGSEDAVTASVSVYMAAVGLCCLLWGPLSDRFGRRAPLLGSLALFLAFTAACPFSPSIGALIVLRALEGAFVGSTVSVTQGVIADTFAPHERGTALGLFFIPLLVGPIVAPIVGGALSAAFTWRATFWLLLALGGALFLVALALPETHPHYAQLLRRQARGEASAAAGTAAAATAATAAGAEASAAAAAKSAAAEAAAEAAAVSGGGASAAASLSFDLEDAPRGELLMPWVPLTMMVETEVLPFVLLSGVNFGAMFMSLTMLPTLLAAPPYSLTETSVGLCYIPIGVSMMVGSTLGGQASDRAAAASPGVASARVVPSILGSLALPAGAIVFGPILGAGGPLLAALLVGHVLIGLGQSLYMGGFMSYLTTIKQAQASAASAGSMVLNFVIAAVLISAAVPLKEALGAGGLFGLFAAIHALVAAVALRHARLRAAEAVEAVRKAVADGAVQNPAALAVAAVGV